MFGLVYMTRSTRPKLGVIEILIPLLRVFCFRVTQSRVYYV